MPYSDVSSKDGGGGVGEFWVEVSWISIEARGGEGLSFLSGEIEFLGGFEKAREKK